MTALDFALLYAGPGLALFVADLFRTPVWQYRALRDEILARPAVQKVGPVVLWAAVAMATVWTAAVWSVIWPLKLWARLR